MKIGGDYMRLIDALALAITHDYVTADGEPCITKAVIDNAPTIDAVPHWIPCEERMPEPNVAVLGYAPAFHNIFTVCYDSVYGWMTWCPVCDEPFPSSQGEIIAWMPLPKPYEGERKDNEID